MVDRHKDEENCATCFPIKRKVKWKATRMSNGRIQVRYLCNKCKGKMTQGWIVTKRG